MMRYTYTLRQLMGSDPCPEREAFTGTIRSRVGHYNDCFLQEGSSEFNDDKGPWSYTSVQGSWTPDPGCGVRPSIQSVIENLDNQHFDFIENEIDKLTGLPENDPGIQSIYKNIGYRYRLIKSSINRSVNQNGILTLDIDITNDGYGGIFNPRKIEVIMRNKSTGKKFVQEIIGDNVGNRLFFPRSHSTKILRCSRQHS